MFTSLLFLTRKYWCQLLLVLGVLCLGYAVYSVGHKHGSSKIQAKWDAERKGHEIAVVTLQKQINELENINRFENKRIDDVLSKANKEYAFALATLQSEYSVRLRLSEGRVSSYRRLSEGGTAEREYLANHAAKLDGTLEEGRSLVRELREAVGQRDKELNVLSEKIKNDQRLFE